VIQSAIAGLFSGGAYALLGICVVLLYRMVGVLNLAQAAVGVFGAYIMTVLADIGLPVWLALLLGLISSGLIGALLGLVMVKWFSDADRYSDCWLAFVRHRSAPGPDPVQWLQF
jgi:branched-chain amino acid transport system permease protein